MSLDLELATYRRHLPRLMELAAGQWVVIRGEVIAGTYPTYQDAIEAGYESFGLRPFLAKKIESPEAVARFTRDL